MKSVLETLKSLEQEILFYNGLTEEQTCEIYNVDYKEEARQYILDYWR